MIRYFPFRCENITATNIDPKFAENKNATSLATKILNCCTNIEYLIDQLTPN